MENLFLLLKKNVYTIVNYVNIVFFIFIFLYIFLIIHKYIITTWYKNIYRSEVKVTHTRNLCSTFYPSKCTHTVNTHTHTHTHIPWKHTHTHTHTHTVKTHTYRENTHTHTVNTHTHTLWTHTRSSGQLFMLWRPGSSWGYGALLRGTSVVVLRV